MEVLKDHQIAELVNDLRDIAVIYGHTQQLREQISSRLEPVLRVLNRNTIVPEDGNPVYVRNPNVVRVATQGGRMGKFRITYRSEELPESEVTRTLMGRGLAQDQCTADHCYQMDELGNVPVHVFRHTLNVLVDIMEADLRSAS